MARNARTLVIVGALAASVLAGVPTSVGATPAVTPIGTGTRVTAGLNASAAPREIIRAGAAMWFTEPDRAVIGRLVPGQTAEEFSVAPLTSPHALVEGPDGAVWFATTGKISRITGSGEVTSYPLGGAYVGSSPASLAVGPDDAIWFVMDLTSKLGRMTATGDVAYTSINAPVGTISDIVFGPDDALWMTSASSSVITRVALDGEMSAYALPTDTARAANIIVGPDDAMWFTETLAGQVGRIDTAGFIEEFPTGSSSRPRDITIGPDGAFWLTDFDNAQIGRITTAGKSRWYSSGAEPTTPDHIAAGPDRALWVADPAANALSRVSAGYPGRPTGVSAAPLNRALDVSWSAPDDLGGNPISSYVATASPGGATCRTFTGTSCRITGLTNGEHYTVTVVASNGRGSSLPSTASAPRAPRTIPGAPTGLEAEPGLGKVTLSWNPPGNDGGAPISRYVVDRPAGVTCSVSGRSATCTGLKTSRNYAFTVSAMNAAGAGPGATVTASPGLPPSEPRNVTARVVRGTIQVQWDAPASDGGHAVTDYIAYSSLNPSKRCSTSQLSCDISGAPDGSQRVMVVALNSIGTGPAASSNQVSKGGGGGPARA